MLCTYALFNVVKH